MTRWTAFQKSEFAHEQSAIDLLAGALPDRPPFHAWSNFEFFADDGSINEVDALVVSARCIYLIEIKHWIGKISGNHQTWTRTTPNRTFGVDNPLLLTDRKAKKLKSLLERQPAFRKRCRVPYIKAIVFLSHPDCEVDLSPEVAQHVYQHTNGPQGIVKLIQGEDDANGPGIGREQERAVCNAMAQIGVRKRSRSPQVGDYQLDKLLQETNQYQDWLATHARIKEDRKRVRIFTQSRDAAPAEREDRKDLAAREYRVLTTVSHDSILKPIHLTDTDAGPALIYDFNSDAVRLDQYLNTEGRQLGIGQRIELVRSIAETIQYAHQRGVRHRALSPWTIEVDPSDGAPHPVLRDWQSVGTAETGTQTVGTRATLHAGLIDGEFNTGARAYVPPEVLSDSDYDGQAVDIFCLGALTYAILSGQHPADSAEDLLAKLTRTTGLLISDAMDGAPESLIELVQLCTDPVPASRPESASVFLDLLDDVEEELTAPEPTVGVHPHKASKGDVLTGGFVVDKRLGKGSTCVALAVQRGEQSGVLKVAKEAAMNTRVEAEARVLQQLKHHNIVQIFSLEKIDGLSAIFMERGGETTLDERLRSEGRLSLDLLDRFGSDLLLLLDYLEDQGINHRDIKPVNIGIGTTPSKRLTLKLFDFSLSDTPASNIHAGTPPYLDPFLSTRKPPVWDLNAERFSAAMTLYELATGTLPSWGEAGISPLATDEEARLDVELFDPAVRDGLTAFFSKAIARNARKRFDNAADMHLAWRGVFSRIDQPQVATTSADETTDDATTEHGFTPVDLSAIDGLSPNTPLEQLGLTARELDAATRMGAGTVSELLALPNIRFYRNRGIGNRLTSGFRTLRDQLAQWFDVQPADDESENPAHKSIDYIVKRLTGIKVDEQTQALLQSWLGVRSGDSVPERDLPDVRQSATAVGMPRTAALDAIDLAVAKWAKNQWMTAARDQIVDVVQRREGIVTVAELTDALLALHGSTATDIALRRQRARALVQAALEVENQLEAPRFLLLRGALAPVIMATDQLGEAFGAPTGQRLKFAETLAATAERLAQTDPLPSPHHVHRELAEVPAPTGDQPISADRRIRLAAAVTENVALSSRLELYPVGLEAVRALRMGSSALLGPKRLSVAHLKNRIRSRFPQAEELPDRPALDALLQEADIPLQWCAASEEQPAGYAPPQRGSGLTEHTISTRRSHTAHMAAGMGIVAPGSPEEDALVQIDQTLERALSNGRVLIVTCPPRRIEQAAELLPQHLAATHPLERLSLDALLIGAMRELANSAKADWQVVLRADAATQDSQDWHRLNLLVNRALPQVDAALDQHKGPVLLQHLGLLARYQQTGWVQRLRDRSQAGDANARPPARLLLVGGDADSPPRLGTTILPTITPADWLHLPATWLEAAQAARRTSQESAPQPQPRQG